MKIRLEQHKLKRAHLDFLFERSLKVWKVHAYESSSEIPARAKYYSNLCVKLSNIKAYQKESLLEEYYKMCQMTYRMKAIVFDAW